MIRFTPKPLLLTAITLAALAVSAPRLAQSAPAAPAPRSLYDRLGGLMGITQVVDDFINKMVVDKQINMNRAVADARKRVPAAYLKFQVSAMVCKVTGGPCNYTGRDMKSSHADLHISEKEWARMAAIFKTSLDKYKVPKTEQDELFAIVGTTHDDIVGKK